MSKPISPYTHGFIDYGAVALMLAAPGLLGLKGSARTLSYVFGGSYLVVSALTKYQLGLDKLIPFPVHGTIELSSVPALLALPLLTGAFKETGERAYFLGLAATVATVYSLTDWQGNTES